MTPRTLTTLISIAEQGSFARAAAANNMTISAVSMQMKALESELQVTLFDRQFRPPRLTPIGKQVAEEAKHVVAAYGRLVGLCRDTEPLHGNFHIGFVLTASVRLLPGFLVRARSQFRNAAFTVETGLSDDLLQRVAASGLDAAVITGGEMLPGTIRQTVLTEEELVYCLPAFAGDWEISTAMEKLAFLHFMPEAGIGRLIARHLAYAKHVPRETIVLDSVEAVAECVKEGIGFGVLPEPDARRHAGTDVHLRSMITEKVMRELVLVTRRDTAADAAAETIAAALRG